MGWLLASTTYSFHRIDRTDFGCLYSGVMYNVHLDTDLLLRKEKGSQNWILNLDETVLNHQLSGIKKGRHSPVPGSRLAMKNEPQHRLSNFCRA